MSRLIALALVSSQLSCAMWASANAAHSHITPCVDNPVYGVIDVIIASTGALALVGTEVGLDQPLWFIAPGVFLVSGVVGTIEVIGCKGHAPRPTPVYPDPAPEIVVTDGGVSQVPDAGGDEEAAPVPPPPPGPTLTLPADYDVGSGSASSDDAGDAGDAGTRAIDCSIEPCPSKYACRLDERNRARCMPE